MLGILIDAVLIVMIVYVVNGGDEVDFQDMIWPAIGITVISLVLLIGAAMTEMIVVIIGAYFILALIVGFIIALTTGIPVKNAMIGGVVFVVIKFLISLGLTLVGF